MEVHNRGGVGLKRGSPLFFSLISMAGGAVILLALVFNTPFELSPDVDSDGMSDHFQTIEEERELVLTGSGWSNAVVGYSSEVYIPALLLLGGLLLFFIPVLVFSFLWQRPRMIERYRLRKEEGLMLDIVRRLASFLEIDPSLQSAVAKTQSSLPLDQQRVLAPLIWDPMTKGIPFNEAYGRFSRDWMERSPLIGRALISLAVSSREKDQAAISSSVKRTMKGFDKGSRELIKEYARSLSGPSTALFAMGVLLPLMLATMIPLMGLSGSNLFMIGFFLWAMVPLGILYYGRMLVERRPMLKEQDSSNKAQRSGLSFPLLLLSSGLFILGTTVLADSEVLHLPLDIPSMNVIGIFISFSFLISGSIRLFTRPVTQEERTYLEKRERSSSILHSIGTDLEEGRSFESSLVRASIKDGSTAPPFPGDISYIQRLEAPLDHLLGTAKHFSRAGPEAGGGAVKALAGHLEEMHSMERDLSSRIRSSIGQMGITSSVFAPLMIGSSVGIFRLMEGSASSVPSGIMGGSMGSGIGLDQFMVLSAGYLMMLAVATSLTLYRLEKGRTEGGWNRVPRVLVLSSLSFAAASILSSMLIG